MQTQCPKCLKVFEIPDHYLNKTVKCEGCKAEFCAIKYVEPLKLPDFGKDIYYGKPQEYDPNSADIPTGYYLYVWGVIFIFPVVLLILGLLIVCFTGEIPQIGPGLGLTIVGCLFIALLLFGLETICKLLRLQLALLRKVLEKSEKNKF